MYPFTEQTARSALSNTNSFGVATGDTHDTMDDDPSSLPTTALLHSALQREYPVATRLGKKGASLQLPEDLAKIQANAVVSQATSRASTSATTPPIFPTPSSTPPPAPTAPFPPSPTVRFDSRTPPTATTRAATRGLESPRRQGLTLPPGTPSTSAQGGRAAGWQGGRATTTTATAAMAAAQLGSTPPYAHVNDD